MSMREILESDKQIQTNVRAFNWDYRQVIYASSFFLARIRGTATV